MKSYFHDLIRFFKLCWYDFIWITTGPFFFSTLAIVVAQSDSDFARLSPNEQERILFIVSVSAAVFFLSIFVFMRPRSAFMSGSPLKSLPIALGVGAVLLMVKWSLNHFLGPPNSYMPSSGDVAVVFLVFAIAPFVEEAFFRGVVWKEFQERGITEPVTLIATTILYALAHVPLNLNSLLQLLFMGACLGIIRYFSGSIWLGIAFHMLMNLIVLSQI